MKCSVIIFEILLVSTPACAHYIFDTLIVGTKTSTKAVRRPTENSPVHNYTDTEIACNINTSNATETPTTAAGTLIGFTLGENKTIYHLGPVSMYLGKAPSKVVNWDGSGKRWFKIREWGATFNPFTFSTLNKSKFTAYIPKEVPSGEYLVRIEQIALHIPGAPEFFVSCAQLKITHGGTGTPSKVLSIPGYLSDSDPGLTVNIYWPIPTSYVVPGPKVYPSSKKL